jgi:hypothetical protein
VASPAASAPSWEKFTLDQVLFHGAGTQRIVNVTPILAGDAIFTVVMRPTVEWAGAGMAVITACLGVTVVPDKYLPDSDLAVPPSATTFYAASVLGIEQLVSGGTQLVMRVTSDGGPLSGLSAGSVDVWVLRSRMPS